MDLTGYVLIALAILLLVAAAAGFLKLSDLAPRGVVLIVAVALFIVGRLIPTSSNRILDGLIGVFQIAAVIGILVGIYDLRRFGSKAEQGKTANDVMKQGLIGGKKDTSTRKRDA